MLGLPDRFWACKEVPRQPDTPAHPVPRGQEPDRHGAVRQHQRSSRHRAESARRHGVARLRPDVLQPGIFTLAGAQGTKSVHSNFLLHISNVMKLYSAIVSGKHLLMVA